MGNCELHNKPKCMNPECWKKRATSAVASNDEVINAVSDKDRSDMFKNLMCYIHRDGGQYMADHGEIKAYYDALDKILPLIHKHL